MGDLRPKIENPAWAPHTAPPHTAPPHCPPTLPREEEVQQGPEAQSVSSPLEPQVREMGPQPRTRLLPGGWPRMGALAVGWAPDPAVSTPTRLRQGWDSDPRPGALAAPSHPARTGPGPHQPLRSGTGPEGAQGSVLGRPGCWGTGPGRHPRGLRPPPISGSRGRARAVEEVTPLAAARVRDGQGAGARLGCHPPLRRARGCGSPGRAVALSARCPAPTARPRPGLSLLSHPGPGPCGVWR